MQEIIQEKYHVQLFGVLIPALEVPEPRYAARLDGGWSNDFS
jgi:hypothetical protein